MCRYVQRILDLSVAEYFDAVGTADNPQIFEHLRGHRLIRVESTLIGQPLEAPHVGHVVVGAERRIIEPMLRDSLEEGRLPALEPDRTVPRSRSATLALRAPGRTVCSSPRAFSTAEPLVRMGGALCRLEVA